MVNKLPLPPTPNEIVGKINGIIDDKQDTLVSGTNIKTINNESILGSGNITISGGGGGGSTFIPYGESDSAADATQKEVTISSITSLSAGQIIIVKPTITSTVADSTLKLNDFTAYPMRYGAAAITTSTDSVVWSANYPSWFRFDGDYWVFLGHGVDNNTTYSTMSVAEGTAGTASSNRSLQARYLKQIIQGTTLTGISTSTTGAVTASDTVTTGIGKLQATKADKSAIPTVNNATLTIQKNGSNVATFTANASSNVTANISVPNTVSSVSSSSTNADAVGAKLFYDPVGDIEAALHAINSGGVQTATLTVRVYDNLNGFYSFTINGETYTDFSTSGDIGELKTKDINIPINTDLPWTASTEDSSYIVTPASGTSNISSDYILELDVEMDEPII